MGVARVLIVEDDPLVASCVEAMLVGSGYRVTGIAASAPAALFSAEAEPPDIALVDIRLTGPMDGIEFACLLHSRLSVPSIFLTGLLDADVLERAAVAQPLGFLRKPVRLSDVFNAVDRALQMKITLAAVMSNASSHRNGDRKGTKDSGSSWQGSQRRSNYPIE